MSCWVVTMSVYTDGYLWTDDEDKRRLERQRRLHFTTEMSCCRDNACRPNSLAVSLPEFSFANCFRAQTNWSLKCAPFGIQTEIFHFATCGSVYSGKTKSNNINFGSRRSKLYMYVKFTNATHLILLCVSVDKRFLSSSIIIMGMNSTHLHGCEISRQNHDRESSSRPLSGLRNVKTRNVFARFRPFALLLPTNLSFTHNQNQKSFFVKLEIWLFTRQNLNVLIKKEFASLFLSGRKWATTTFPLDIAAHIVKFLILKATTFAMRKRKESRINATRAAFCMRARTQRATAHKWAAVGRRPSSCGRKQNEVLSHKILILLLNAVWQQPVLWQNIKSF